MMRQMRDNMKVIMIITAVTFVGLMVFDWGMGISGRSSAGTPGVLGKVNGQPITIEEFQNAYRNLADQAQKGRQEPLTSADNKQLEQSAWDQLVMQKLIAQELKRRGIEVTDAEVREAAKYAPPPELAQNRAFQTNGQFDLAKYQQFLASPAVDNTLLLQLEAYYREVIPQRKLYYQVVSGVFLPDSYLWSVWRDGHETAIVRFVSIDPRTNVPDNAVSVSSAEVSAYYKKHKNEFVRPATARVIVIGLPKLPDAQDTAAARDSALALRTQILGGADFGELAAKVSKDPGSASQGGELGDVRKGQTVPAFEQAAFSLPVGQVSEPVLTQYGFHVIKVESRSDSTARVRHILLPIAVSGAHLDQLTARADSMEKAGEVMPLNEVASRMGLTPHNVSLTREIPTVPGIGRVDDGLDWAFGEGQPKDVSQVFESSSSFYMMELLSRTPAGVLSLADASPLIRTALMVKQKTERARVAAARMVADLRGGRPFEQVAAAAGVPLQNAGPFTRQDFVPGLGRANAAIGAAFGLNPGAVSDPVEANDRFYIIQTLGKQPADRQAFEQQKNVERARLTTTMADQRWQEFLLGLRQTAKIVDNRDKILRPANQPDTATAGF